MSAVAHAAQWRRENAEWLRIALHLLRLQLERYAGSFGGAPDAHRPFDWLLADDERRPHSVPDTEEKALARALGERESSMHDRCLPALRTVAELGGLGAFESDLLLMVAAPSLDGAFARGFAELNDDPRRDYPTLHLALSVFAEPGTERVLAADCLMPFRALRALRLVDVDDDDPEPLLTRRLSIDERMTDYLRGVNRIDARVASFVMPIRETLPTDSARRAAAEAADVIARAAQWSTINIVGDTDGGAREAARRACNAVGLQTQLLDLRRFAAITAADRATLISLLGREALLAGMALVVDASEAAYDSTAALAIDELVATLSGTLLIISAARWSGRQPIEVVRTSRPTRVEQERLWRVALDGQAHSVNGELGFITQQFDFGPDAITDVVSRTSRDGDITGRALWAACRDQTGVSLEDLARRISPSYGWDDIVVSDDVRAQLRELAAQVQQRGRVYESWGFGTQLGRGRGITALFAGPSGTGKTMAAEILAGHLELDLYRIDLAGVVSKFIGETEKNLRRVFDAAERSGAILFFDEADALFGNRTEVRDSHDRYANLEINYLLQRMEDYCGLAVLSTNRRSALDAAFLRRLRFVIEFPFPCADDRRRIWERVFPSQAAVDGLELSFLSGLDLSGGNIKSVAVNAAFLAASENAPIGMTQVVQAAAREYVKLSKPISAAEFGPYYPMVRR